MTTSLQQIKADSLRRYKSEIEAELLTTSDRDRALLLRVELGAINSELREALEFLDVCSEQ